MQRIRDQDQSRNRIPPGTVIESILPHFCCCGGLHLQKNTHHSTCAVIGLLEGLDKLEMDVLLAHSIGSETLVISAHFLNFQFSDHPPEFQYVVFNGFLPFLLIIYLNIFEPGQLLNASRLIGMVFNWLNWYLP